MVAKHLELMQESAEVSDFRSKNFATDILIFFLKGNATEYCLWFFGQILSHINYFFGLLSEYLCFLRWVYLECGRTSRVSSYEGKSETTFVVLSSLIWLMKVDIRWNSTCHFFSTFMSVRCISYDKPMQNYCIILEDSLYFI